MQHGRVLSHAAAAARVEVPTAARHAERQRCRDFAPCRVWPRRVNLRADRKRAGVALAASLNGEPVDLNKLHSALSRAVEAEDYSLAASIRDSINKAMKAQGIEDGPSDWKSIGILPWLADRVEQLGFRLPTPIQRRVIPAIMSERDTLVQALTGSGKTLAFLLPALSMLDYEVARDDITSPGMLVVTPTRELGVQIFMLVFKLFGGNVNKGIPGDAGNMFRFSGPRELKVRGILDAKEAVMARDPRYLKGVHVVVATPDALDIALREKLEVNELEGLLRMDDDLEAKKELIESAIRSEPSWVMRKLETIVVDEVDACFERFPGEMRRLLTGHFGLVKPQMVLCGATLTQEHLEEVGSLGVLASPQLVGMGGGEVLPGSIEHLYAVVDAPRKLMTLARLLKKDLTDSGMDDAPPRVMVFASSDEQARQIADPLRTSLWGQHKLSVLLPTGFETVRQMEAFRDNRSTLMVCTPTSARGIDMPAVTHVYLTRVPESAAEYVHAAGRSGRVGAKVDGRCLVLVSPGEEEERFKAMMGELGITATQVDVPGDTLKDLDPSKAGDLDTLKKAMEDLFTLSDGQEPQ